MYITDIRHLQDAAAKMKKEMPEEARGLIGFLILIIDATSKTLPHSLTPTNINCFEKGCSGIIKSAFRPDTEEIHWYCPDCENEGVINNWQGTQWDHR